jgi:uncharacterized protein YdeI (YjbR/CyaY-like superfamily)
VQRTLDGRRSILLLTPRRPGSRWSGANKARVERLVADGLMAPAGLGAVEAAMSDGTWTALDGVERLEEPTDLRAALDADRAARGHWDLFPRSTRRGLLEWVLDAKGADTRARRVRSIDEEAREGRRANQWRRPGRAPGDLPGGPVPG